MDNKVNILAVNTTQGSYDIHIQSGLLGKLGSELRKIYSRKNIAVITDQNLNRLYGDTLRDVLLSEGFEVHSIIVAPGEGSKSLETLGKVYDSLADSHITRDSLIAAFGGGVVGDLAGFAAATWLRGVPFVQIPTSLLAQIDSSIGGKTAINLSCGKNMAGCFYQPEAVFIDPQLLHTLEDKYLNDGMAEVIKYGAIKDRELFELLLTLGSREELFDNIDKIIHTCCSIKKQTVQKDERDQGERLLLNFGHTIGHALESYFKYEKYSHGEAVAIGMHAITEGSEAMGLTCPGTAAGIRAILKKYELPWELPDIDKESLLGIMGKDKKGSETHMRIVLLNAIGESFIHKIDISELHKYVVPAARRKEEQ